MGGSAGAAPTSSPLTYRRLRRRAHQRVPKAKKHPADDKQLSSGSYYC
jgi:hypothetical protein